MSTAADYPDWGSRTAIVGASRISFNQAIGAPAQSAVTYMYDYEYIHCLVANQGYNGHYGITLSWFDAAGGVTEFAANGFNTIPGQFTAFKFPVVAPYLKAAVVNLDDTSGANFIMDIFPSSISAEGLGVSESGAPLIQSQGNVAASTTITAKQTGCYKGRATFTAWQAAGTAWSVNLVYFDSATKTFKDLARLDSHNGAFAQGMQVDIPPTEVQLQITNNATTSAFLNAILCAGGR